MTECITINLPLWIETINVSNLYQGSPALNKHVTWPEMRGHGSQHFWLLCPYTMKAVSTIDYRLADYHARFLSTFTTAYFCLPLNIMNAHQALVSGNSRSEPDLLSFLPKLVPVQHFFAAPQWACIKWKHTPPSPLAC